MPDALLFALVGCILGMAMVAVSLVITRSARAWFYLPLTGLLMAIVILVLPPVIAATLPVYKVGAIAAGLPAIMVIGPLLWLYVSALTSETEWRWSLREFFHLVPAMLALGVIAGFQALPVQVREAMVLRGEAVETAAPALVATLAWLLITLWVPQSCYYLIRSGKRLLHYRRQLKQMFANTEHRHMAWLSVLIVLLGLVWLMVILAVIGSNVFNVSFIGREGLTLLALIAVWILAVCGLSQRPGYHGHYAQEKPAPDGEMPSSAGDLQHHGEQIPPEKYRRSALDQTQSARIASKIERIMVDEQLYLNSDLTLGDLARAVNAPSNYVSQTLNETLGETFFDYVNKKRVEAAQQLLRTTEKTAMDIAYEVGFNARSSFYKAFQQQTGLTPGQFREQPASRYDQ